MSDDVPAPVTFEWDGEVMIPLNAGIADREYVVHQQYRLAPVEERDMNSHRHYFAALHDAWENLPEKYAEHFPTSEHLRKWALIKAGYRDDFTFVFDTQADMARFINMCRRKDQYCVVVQDRKTVTAYFAHSQDTKSMGKEKFQKSKWAVLDAVSKLVGVSVTEMRKNAGKAA